MPVKRAAAILIAVMVLGMASVAQTAPATLTPQERELALKELQRTRDKFLQSIAGLSQKQWTFKPAPDRWSVAEVAEHIAVAESGILS
jgi:hypothetical protein